jgi:hypothetical protein
LTTITIYNLNPAQLGLVDRIDVTSSDSDKRRRTYNGLELGFNARMGRGSAFGGYTFDRLGYPRLLRQISPHRNPALSG